MSVTTVLVVGVIVVLVIARRVYGEPVRARRLLVMPLVELAIGGYELTEAGGLPTGEWVSLAATGVISVAVGAARGGTLHLFERRGYLWQRYRPRTFAVWAGAFVARFGVRALLAATGVTGGAMSARQMFSGDGPGDALIAVMLITSGLGFAGESVVLTPRALATGVPLAPPGTRGGLLTGLLGDGGADRYGPGAGGAVRHRPGGGRDGRDVGGADRYGAGGRHGDGADRYGSGRYGAGAGGAGRGWHGAGGARLGGGSRSPGVLDGLLNEWSRRRAATLGGDGGRRAPDSGEGTRTRR